MEKEGEEQWLSGVSPEMSHALKFKSSIQLNTSADTRLLFNIYK